MRTYVFEEIIKRVIGGITKWTRQYHHVIVRNPLGFYSKTNLSLIRANTTAKTKSSLVSGSDKYLHLFERRERNHNRGEKLDRVGKFTDQPI